LFGHQAAPGWRDLCTFVGRDPINGGFAMTIMPHPGSSTASTNPVTAPRTDVHGKSFWTSNGLSIVLLALFAVTAVGQSIAGWLAYDDQQQDHGQPAVAYVAYLGTGHFWEALGENWESEFLQMAAFVILTACLFQKGSPESRDPDAPDEPEAPITDASPWAARKGGWVRWTYERSLSIALLVLFVLSLAIHAVAGKVAYNQEQVEHGKQTISLGSYVVSSQFWFESFQNWQSEFLSIAAMVVLAIFLRQKGSPESKDVGTPHWRNE
jgi:hypothetical protein